MRGLYPCESRRRGKRKRVIKLQLWPALLFTLDRRCFELKRNVSFPPFSPVSYLGAPKGAEMNVPRKNMNSKSSLPVFKRPPAPSSIFFNWPFPEIHSLTKYSSRYFFALLGKYCEIQNESFRCASLLPATLSLLSVRY